jgi:hypothetical protein
MFWSLQLGIGATAIAGFVGLGVACSSTSTTTDTGTDTGTDTEVATDTGSDTGTDTGSDTDTGTGTGVSCMECACKNKSGDTPAGCADTCDNTISMATTPNFCNGMKALTQCQMCIMMRCGVSDPTMCN